MDITRIINLVSGKFSPKLKRKEPKEFVYGYDLYSEMPDGLLGAKIPDENNWFDESIYAVPSVPTETSIHQKMYELSSQNLNIGGSETLT